MTNDGTSMGINAERALETILGGKESPDEDEQQSRDQVRQRIGQAPRLAEIHRQVENRFDGGEQVDVEVLYYQGKELNLGYGECADVAARAVLDFIETHPEHESAPMDNEYDRDALRKVERVEDMPPPTRIGMYDVMKQNGYDLGLLGLTGFMWGFAYNTARWLRFEEGEGNPAILEVDA